MTPEHETNVIVRRARELPTIGFLSLRDVIGDDTTVGIIPVSPAVWYEGVAEGRYPKPVRIAKRRVAYRVEDIKALVERLGKGEQ